MLSGVWVGVWFFPLRVGGAGTEVSARGVYR
jgi:hypothetical protein